MKWHDPGAEERRNTPEIAGDCGETGVPAKSAADGVRVVIVCSCNVLSDQQVRAVTAANAVRATSQVYRCLGCSAACGRCVRTIRNIMDEVHAGTETGAEMSSPSICMESEPVMIAAE